MNQPNTNISEISSSDNSFHPLLNISKIILFYQDKYDKCRRNKIPFIVQFLIVIILFIIAIISYQHMSLSYSFTSHTIPKYRIAHCITGVPRTLYKEEVYVAYRRQALNQLPGDLFVVLQLMGKDETIHEAVVKSSSQEVYNTALKFLSPRKIEWIPINDHLGAIDDPAGNAKWQRCLEHIEEAERQDGLKYDFIVRSRPDLYIAKDLPTPNLLPKDRILINPYYECAQDMPSGYNQTWPDIQPPCNKKNYGLSDLFAILPRSLADPYMRMAYTSNLPRHVCGTRASHPECGIRAALYKANITFELWPFVVKVMRSAEFCRQNGWNRFNSWC